MNYSSTVNAYILIHLRQKEFTMFQQKRVIFLIFSLLIILSLFWGCDDNPLSPENEPEKDYIMYMFETDHAGGHYYMGYHPVSGVIDTFTAEDSPHWTMKVSADGRYMFVAAEDYVAKVDLKTKSTIATLPNRAYGMFVSPNNKYLALLTVPGIMVVRVSDLKVLYEDMELDFYNCTFSSDGNKIYGCVRPTYNIVTILDLENNFSKSAIELPQGLATALVVPSIDESKLFLITYYDMWFNHFEVYDRALDSVIFREWIWNGYNYIELSPDGKYVFYTEGGNEFDVNGSNYFTIYDIERNRIKMKVSTVGVEDGINPEFMVLGQMAITPDGKWLVIGESIDCAAFIRFNMTTMQIDDYVQGEINEFGIYLEGYSCFTCQTIQ